MPISQFERCVCEGLSLHRLSEIERVAGERLRVAGTWFGQTSGRHDAVADRLDLLATVPLSEFVRDGEEAVQHAYRRFRAGLTRGRRKSDDVREEHADAIVSIGDPLARLKSFSHRRRENVQEERV